METTMPFPGDNRCPLCRAALWAPAGEAIGSRDCPRCGAALWVLVGAAGPMFFVRQAGQSKAGFLAALAGPSSEAEMEQVLRNADSLDLVELVMDIEEGLRSGE